MSESQTPQCWSKYKAPIWLYLIVDTEERKTKQNLSQTFLRLLVVVAFQTVFVCRKFMWSWISSETMAFLNTLTFSYVHWNLTNQRLWNHLFPLPVLVLHCHAKVKWDKNVLRKKVLLPLISDSFVLRLLFNWVVNSSKCNLLKKTFLCWTTHLQCLEKSKLNGTFLKVPLRLSLSA